MKKIKKISYRFAQPDIMFYTLPWLMVLLVIGTIAQRDLGLYHAEKMFFSSWILWFGYIPLPGGLLTLSLIFLNLTAKFILKSKWSWQRSGTIITHFGILLLFVGAILTAATTKEGFVLIFENSQNNKILDYHHKKLYVNKGQERIAEIALKDIEELTSLNLPQIPFQIEVIHTCQNCTFLENDIASKDRKGLAEKIKLTDAPLLKEDEANLSGITFKITKAGIDNGTYISTEAAPHPVVINDYSIQLQRAESDLPFSIHLNDFVRKNHPGTETPQAFHSDIEIIDNGLNWETRIGMNEPLRYKGYTLFQSSFADTPKGEATILAVVKNAGWLFPYIASLIIAFGLLLHLFLRMGKRYE